jgi:hypothetical protein
MTPWPFAVNQLPTGLFTAAADAADTMSPNPSAALQRGSARDLACWNIEPSPVVTIGPNLGRGWYRLNAVPCHMIYVTDV